MHSKTTDAADRREFPRILFKASSLVIEPTSAEIVLAHTTELSRFGCFVETIKPLPRRSRIHVEIADDEGTFTASGVVAYVTSAGMGIAFGMVESKSYEILAKWLSRTPRRSARFDFNATAEVRDLASRNEQVAITRDVSTGGCFIKTVAPLPKGTRIRVRIEHNGAEFTAIGRVTDNVSAIGMGVEFLEVEPKYRTILDNWLPGKP
jgi:DNA-directed RNA polymerase subunit E'/Rpb7